MRNRTNATATVDTQCTTCKTRIPAGTMCLTYRERALSYREAQSRGTMYPARVRCWSCQWSTLWCHLAIEVNRDAA